MKAFRLDRGFWLAIALLLLNASGWWWVKHHPFEKRVQPEPDGAPERVSAPSIPEPVPVLKPLKLTSAVQVALSPERLMTLSLTFSGPVDWPSLAARLTLVSDGQLIAWDYVSKVRPTACQIRTEGPVHADRIEMRFAAGVQSVSRDFAELAEPVAYTVAVVPEFRFSVVETSTPPFGQPYVIVRFTQQVDVRDAVAQIESEPPVPLTITPGPYGWGNDLQVTGPFKIGAAYTLVLKAGLRSCAEHRLGREVRRTVIIKHRQPSLSIPVEGCTLAPEGDLLVPVLAVNTPHVVSSLARVLPQNLVQYAMREGGHYRGWWSDDPAELLAQDLTARAVVRTNALPAARDQEQRLMLRLNDYGQEPAWGVYVLEVSAPDVKSCSRLVCVTDIGLSARCDAEAVTVWVTALRTGRPLPGVHVELYGRNNLLWAQGVSDTQGLVRLARKAGEGAPLLVLAMTADVRDLSFLRLTDGSAVEQRPPVSRGYLQRGACEAFVMSDRDIYRHGERAFVQALLRQADGKPPVPFPSVLHVVKPDGRTFKTVPVMPDALGAVTAEVTLPDYLPSGTYTFELRRPGGGAVLGAHPVMLEAFVPPQTRVKLTDLPAAVRADGDLTCKVSAEHLFGKPAAGLSAAVTLAFLDGKFTPKGWEGFLFGDAERSWVRGRLSCPRQTLAEDGTAVFSAKADVQGLPPAQVRVRVEAAVTETSGRTVSAQAESKLDPYPFYIGVAPGDGRVVRAGTPRTVRLAAVKPDGTRHVEKTPLLVRVERVDWVSSLIKEPSGKYRWESERVKTTVSEARAETGPEDASHTFTVDGTGEYVMTFTDPVSQASTSWTFAAGEDGQTEGNWSRASPDRVALVFDKETYRPGETARLQLRAPFSGQAWVALSHDRLLENRVLDLTNNTATLAWTVTEAFVPNVAVSVSVVRPVVGEGVWGAHRASGAVLLRVLPSERALTVRVQPDAVLWRPKNKGIARVAVTDSDGRPASGAAVTVLAVDEGVCLLTDYVTPDPYGYFMAARWGDLGFFDVYRNLMPITSERMFGAASHIGGDDGGDKLLKRLNPVAARRFKPLALWQANVKTDAAGCAEVPFELPEFAGELRLMAIAGNANAVGAADAVVKVKRKLVVQPDLPRFLAPGDQTAVEVVLHNESGADCAARVSVRTEGPLSCAQDVTAASLKAGASSVLQVPVTARAQAGTARVIVRVEGAGEVYEEPVELAVRPAAALCVANESIVLQPGEERAFEPPHGMLEGSFRQTFFCSAHSAVNLFGALEYVVEYPYGCLEQTVSGALPLLALSGLEDRFPSRESSLAQEATDRINAALLRVLSMRRSNGFAMWPDVREIDPQATLYAALFLVQASQAGYVVPKETLSETVQFLRDRLSAYYYYGDVPCACAYVCHVLALAGSPEHAWMLRLYERMDSLKPEERFHLARALIRSGEVERGREVLAQSRSVQGIREAAFALLAWLEIDPANPAVAICCREIEKTRRSEGHWGSTQDNALALLAMGAYLRAIPEQPHTFSPTLKWGADHTRTVAATNAYTWTPGAGADRGTVGLRNEGPGAMYVTRRISYVPNAAKVEAVDAGMKVRRTVLDMKGQPVDLAGLQRGDVVIVRLELDPLERILSDVVVEELLPAGLEIENAKMAAAGTLPWIKPNEDNWVLHREVRDDRLLLFSKTFYEKKHFHYAARVVSPGEFTLPQVRASAMYAPDIYSCHGFGRVTVK